MNNYNIDEIAEWAIGTNTYNREEILNLPNHYLVIEIKSNQPSVIKCERLSDGRMEQRQFSMLRMLEILCSKYQIPDLILGYCGHDKSPDTNGPFFTHSRIKGTSGRNILAPCFTFYGYPERYPDIIKEYTKTWEELIEHNRKNRNFMSRESLSRYKFLPHFNGHNGAFSARLMYLLGTESFVIYNYNSGEESNFWEEWWMKDDVFIEGKHFVSVRDKGECEESLKYYFENQNIASEIATNGFKFFEEFLSPDNIEKYWVSLLNLYSKKIN